MLLWETMQNTLKEFQFLTLRAISTSAVLCCRACSMKCVSYFICWLFQRGFYEPAMNDAAEKLKIFFFCFLPRVTFARFSPH